MAIYTLDTRATIKELEAAGMESRQAEAVVAAIITASQSKISRAGCGVGHQEGSRHSQSRNLADRHFRGRRGSCAQ